MALKNYTRVSTSDFNNVDQSTGSAEHITLLRDINTISLGKDAFESTIVTRYKGGAWDNVDPMVYSNPQELHLIIEEDFTLEGTLANLIVYSIEVLEGATFTVKNNLLVLDSIKNNGTIINESTSDNVIASFIINDQKEDLTYTRKSYQANTDGEVDWYMEGLGSPVDQTLQDFWDENKSNIDLTTWKPSWMDQADYDSFIADMTANGYSVILQNSLPEHYSDRSTGIHNSKIDNLIENQNIDPLTTPMPVNKNVISFTMKDGNIPIQFTGTYRKNSYEWETNDIVGSNNWTCIINPYSAPISISALIEDNKDAFYGPEYHTVHRVFTSSEKTIEPYSKNSNTDKYEYLAPGEGFFVRLKSNSKFRIDRGLQVISDSDKAQGMYRDSTYTLSDVGVKGIYNYIYKGSYMQSYILFTDDATDGIDPGMDIAGMKFDRYNTHPDIGVKHVLDSGETVALRAYTINTSKIQAGTSISLPYVIPSKVDEPSVYFNRWPQITTSLPEATRVYLTIDGVEYDWSFGWDWNEIPLNHANAVGEYIEGTLTIDF